MTTPGDTQDTRMPPGVVEIRSGNHGAPPLVCISPSGSFELFEPLANCLPPGIPVLAIESDHLPIETLVEDSLEQQAARFLDLLRAAQAHGPYRLIGFSFGAHVAYEMTQRLLEEKESVEYLGLIDIAPITPAHHGLSQKLASKLSLLAKIPSRGAMAFRARGMVSKQLAGLVGDTLRRRSGGMSLRERFEALRLEVLRHDKNADAGNEAPPQDDTPAAQAYRLRIARKVNADKLAMAAYQTQPVAAPLYLYASGDERNSPSRASFAAAWEGFAEKGLTSHWLECSHMKLMYPPAVAALGEVVTQDLARAQAAE